MRDWLPQAQQLVDLWLPHGLLKLVQEEARQLELKLGDLCDQKILKAPRCDGVTLPHFCCLFETDSHETQAMLKLCVVRLT